MSAPGPHAVLLVIEFGPITRRERDAVMKVEEIFGKEVWKYTIILFTHGDKAKPDHDEKLKRPGTLVKEILDKSGNRYHLFNNLNVKNRHQVKVLLDKVQKMVDENRGEFFSNDKYQNTTKMLDQREAELKEKLEKKYEEQLKQAKKDQKVKEQLESELEELKRYYRTLESGVRQTLEQITKDDEYKELLEKFPESLKLN